jgi:hypothetical protein
MSLAVALKYRAIAVDKLLCAYRIHENNLSAKIPEQGYIESIDIVTKLAPKGRQAELSKYNLARYAFYLLKQKRLSDACSIAKDIGFTNFLLATVALIKYRKAYHSG